MLFHYTPKPREDSLKWALKRQRLVAGISPDVISYNAMMTSYERCSHWQKALDLFISMPAPWIGASVRYPIPPFFGGFCWREYEKEWPNHSGWHRYTSLQIDDLIAAIAVMRCSYGSWIA